MENWGLIHYNEIALFKTNLTTKAQEQTIVRLICHEIIHQWFGDLVTMRWFANLHFG